MKKIGEIAPAKGPKMVICYDGKAKVNPYRVYLIWTETTEHGWPAQHRKQIDRYADLLSCGCLMMEHIRKYNGDGRS